MSTEHNPCLVVGVDAQQAYTHSKSKLSFLDWVCDIQDSTGMTWFEDENTIGHHDKFKSNYSSVDEFLVDTQELIMDTAGIEILEQFGVSAQVCFCDFKV